MDASNMTLGFHRSWEIVDGAFATPNRLDTSLGSLSGCIYRHDGSKVDLSERFGGYGGDWFVSSNPPCRSRPDNAKTIPGRGLYLGHLMSRHYGHFITETLSSFWIFEEFEASDFEYFVFHSFWGRAPLKNYASYCLDRFGISPERVILVDDAPMCFEQLVIPERLFRINHSADVRLRKVYSRLTDPMRRSSLAPGRMIYLSRRGLDPRLLRRTIANEIRIESLFRTAGFEVIFPEKLQFEEQLSIYSSCKVLAGISGSALHNSLFLPEGSLVVELDNLHQVGHATQELCNLVSGATGRFIEFRGRVLHRPRRIMLFELAHVQSELRSILEEHGIAAPGLAGGLPPLRAEEVLDVTSRVMSPVARHAVRRLLGGRR